MTPQPASPLPLPLTPCPVVVMAKAPRPGYAKTRLVPALGAAGAAALAQRLLQHALAQAADAALGPVELCCAPDAGDPLLRPYARPGLVFTDQGEGELGARMQRAFARWLPRAGQALMTGTDCPGLNAAVLRQAAQALGQGGVDAVFVPAFDGGYALIGLRGPDVAGFARLFEDMPWSTPGLMQATRSRLAAAGLRHIELPALPDIDEAADLQHLPAALWP